MATLIDAVASVRDRLDYISRRLILMSLNIHVELNDGRFALSRTEEIRQQSDLSLVSSALSNTAIDELLACIEYYCHEVNQLADSMRSSSTTSGSIQIIDDLCKGSQLCLNVLHNYRHDRIHAVQNILSSPFREDAWHFVQEIDWNLFGKCRIILIRLRIYFLILHQVLTHDIEQLFTMTNNNDTISRIRSSHSSLSGNKRRRIVK